MKLNENTYQDEEIPPISFDDEIIINGEPYWLQLSKDSTPENPRCLIVKTPDNQLYCELNIVEFFGKKTWNFVTENRFFKPPQNITKKLIEFANEKFPFNK